MAVISLTAAKFALAVAAFVPTVQTPVEVTPPAASVAYTTYAPSPQTASSFPYATDTGLGRSAASNTTSFTVFDPAAPLSNAAAGDLLVVVFSNDGSTTPSIDTAYSGNGWTTVGTGASGTAVRGTVYTKIAEATNALRLTTATAEQASWIKLSIRNGSSLAHAVATGSSTNSNPPSLTPPAGVQKYLWLATRSGDSTVIPTVQPADFANLVNIPAAGTGGASTSISWYGLEASTLDPGTFTVANEQWVSFTLAIWNATAEVFPSKATVAVTPYAPAVVTTQSASADPGVGSIGFTGYAPVPVTGSLQSINAPAFSQTITTYAPDVPQPISEGIQVPHGYLALSSPHATVYWTAPTLNEDNSQLVDLTGYKVYYGSTLGVYGAPIVVAPDTTYQVIRFPNGGTWFVQISAYNSTAEESALSDPLTLDVPSNTYAPNAHNGLTQTGGGDFTLATPTLSSSGGTGRVASGTISPPIVTVASDAVLGHSGTGAMSTLVPTITGTGISSAVGAPNIFARYTAYSGGLANTLAPRLFYEVLQNIEGSGTFSPPLVTVSGLSSRGLEWMGGDVEIEADAPEVSGDSAIVLSVTGDGTLEPAIPTLAVTTSLGHPGTGTLTVSNVTLSVTAKIGYVGDVALTVTVPEAIAYGQANTNGVPPTPTYTWSGTISVPNVTILGVGTQNKPGATYFGPGTMSPALPTVEAFADLIPRLSLITSISLNGPPVYVDGEMERHLTIAGTGDLFSLEQLLTGSAKRPTVNVGSGVLSPPPMVIVSRAWGPAFVPPETWSQVSTVDDQWTPVTTQSETWNG